MVFLGIDGGGSKTAFLLEDETGKQLGRYETGPSNWLSAGEDTAKNSIAAGIANLPLQPDVVCAGFAGAGRLEGIRFYEACLRSLLPHARLIVETDAFISYVGAIGLEPGVLLIAGTGSIAIGRQPDGTMIRVGGWGPEFSDEGSGFWIGREAIRNALQAHDANAQPRFVALVCAALQMGSITEVSAAWKSGALTVRSVAAVAGVLLAGFAAEPAAQRILNAAASHLRQIVETAAAQIGVPDCRLSSAGSIASHPVIRKQIGLDFEDPLFLPERGAIIWARSQAQR